MHQCAPKKATRPSCPQTPSKGTCIDETSLCPAVLYGRHNLVPLMPLIRRYRGLIAHWALKDRIFPLLLALEWYVGCLNSWGLHQARPSLLCLSRLGERLGIPRARKAHFQVPRERSRRGHNCSFFISQGVPVATQLGNVTEPLPV